MAAPAGEVTQALTSRNKIGIAKCACRKRFDADISCRPAADGRRWVAQKVWRPGLNAMFPLCLTGPVGVTALELIWMGRQKDGPLFSILHGLHTFFLVSRWFFNHFRLGSAMATSSLIPGHNSGWRTPRVCFVSVAGPCSCMDIWSSLSLWYAISAICMLFFVSLLISTIFIHLPTKHIWPWSADLSPTWPLKQPDKSKWSCCTLHVLYLRCISYVCCLCFCCWWLWLSSTSSSSSSSSSSRIMIMMEVVQQWLRWKNPGAGTEEIKRLSKDLHWVHGYSAL